MPDSMVRRAALTFTVHVVVDRTAITSILDENDARSIGTVIADEITSNLESVPYVESVTVRNQRTRQGDPQ